LILILPRKLFPQLTVAGEYGSDSKDSGAETIKRFVAVARPAVRPFQSECKTLAQEQGRSASQHIEPDVSEWWWVYQRD
jgi:hypothetical protein